ncbi:CYTH domain-containing protein [Paenibacillus lemnae]|uniref:CYTH domain-containing protein n=1 Tax=Paenibacillus lemnae TaxID=1330551 RepID=A0A848MCS7_PAELE|nr:CYTH domain-containing protein [Paenibacillus lemnae]NMO97832.1 CYTH domain-containing protein [Paenibacillus lemnae]
MALEIERKYLLEADPLLLLQDGTLRLNKKQLIEQTYLALDGDQELRVRKLKNVQTGVLEYTHTFKKGWGLAREEVEYSISEGLYEQMIEAHQAVPLIKTRITAEWEGRIVEIDDYTQLNLLVLEIEFSSLEEAEHFCPPSWFGQDISQSKEYSNKKVWRDLQSHGS